MQKRWGALALTGAFVAGLSGCGSSYGDDDFASRCAGHQVVRGWDADATHEVLVDTNPTEYLSEALNATDDVVKNLDLPSSDGLVVDFLVGTDLDDIDTLYCTDFGNPPPGIERTLHATAGQARIVLHPTTHPRSLYADITLTGVTLSDGEETVTVESFVMLNAHLGNWS